LAGSFVWGLNFYGFINFDLKKMPSMIHNNISGMEKNKVNFMQQICSVKNRQSAKGGQATAGKTFLKEAPIPLTAGVPISYIFELKVMIYIKLGGRHG